MRYLAFAAFAFGALCAAPGFAQNRPVAAPAYSSGYAGLFAVQQQQQTLQANQQMYVQGQAAIQGGTQGHEQSQQMLSTLSQRNQAQLDAQAPSGPH
jgi:hypothetical protein